MPFRQVHGRDLKPVAIAVGLSTRTPRNRHVLKEFGNYGRGYRLGCVGWDALQKNYGRQPDLTSSEEKHSALASAKTRLVELKNLRYIKIPSYFDHHNLA